VLFKCPIHVSAQRLIHVIGIRKLGEICKYIVLFNINSRESNKIRSINTRQHNKRLYCADVYKAVCFYCVRALRDALF